MTPKKAPLKDARSYRPISITSIFAGALEKILKNYILFHFDRNDMIATNQYRLLEGKSV